MSTGELAVGVEVRRTAEPEDVAVELVEPLLLAVAARVGRALLAVIHKRRVVVLVGAEPAEVARVAAVGGQRFGRRRLLARVRRPSFAIHQMHHHVARRRVDDVRGPGAGFDPVAVKDLLAVLRPVAVGVQQTPEADELLPFG